MTFSEVFMRYASKHTWARIGPSEIHGIGVFAIREIPAFCDIFPDCKNSFQDISISSLSEFPKPVQKMILDYFYTDSENIWIPDITLNQLNISFFLNSSDNPNCKHHDNGKITSIRNIGIGEELTHCYEYKE